MRPALLALSGLALSGLALSGLALSGLALSGVTAAQPTGAPGSRVAFAQPLGPGPVYLVPLDGPVDGAHARYVERALADAEAAGASVVVLELDTYGGLIEAADRIRTALLDADVPTVAFVNRNAASAGALIALAADRIVMAPGASLGAATAVDARGEYATEKVQSYVRSLMRATAEANGRDPRIAEAMVDERIALPGVKPAGQLLSLSAREALALGVADAVLPTEAAVRAAVGAASRPVVAHGEAWAERVLRVLGSPAVAAVLLLLMLGGLYVEFQTPGLGLAGAVALAAAALFFAPHYLLGLVESWEIAVFALGVVLLLVEVLVLPGFGVAGVAGIVLVMGALLAALVPNVGLAFPGGPAFARAAATLAAALVLTILLAASLGRYLPRSQRFARMVLTPDLSSAAGYVAAEADPALVGQVGRALTPLRPSGAAEIAGRRVDVRAEGAFVVAGTPVEVVRVRGARVEVREVGSTPA